MQQPSRWASTRTTAGASRSRTPSLGETMSPVRSWRATIRASATAASSATATKTPRRTQRKRELLRAAVLHQRAVQIQNVNMVKLALARFASNHAELSRASLQVARSCDEIQNCTRILAETFERSHQDHSLHHPECMCHDERLPPLSIAAAGPHMQGEAVVARAQAIIQCLYPLIYRQQWCVSPPPFYLVLDSAC